MSVYDQIQSLFAEHHRESVQPLIYNVDGYILNVTDMMTDDVAAVIYGFIDNPKAIDDIMENVSHLPYAYQLDIMHWLAQDKEKFDKLCETTNFSEYMDAFATRVFPNNLKDE